MKNHSSDLPSVTIITVCKNAGQDLIRTCQSVLNQTFTNIQYIIQDAVSDDDITLSYIYSLQDSRVSVFSGSDSGIYDAMNRAIEKANGKWCIFLNAGDYFRSNESLARIVTDAEAETEIDLFVFANYNEFSKTIKTYPKKISRYFLYRNAICHQGQLWKTDALKKYLPFDLNYKILADQELLLRAFSSGIKIKTSSSVGVVYKDMGLSAMPSVQSIKNMERENIRNNLFEPTENKVFFLIDFILLKSLRLKFVSTFRGTILFQFYIAFINRLNRIL
jgi:glycosyltransferase involved in cell wall biosynthesis